MKCSEMKNLLSLFIGTRSFAIAQDDSSLSSFDRVVPFAMF